MVYMGFFTDLMQSIPLNSVLRERVALAEQKLDDLSEENEKLSQEITVLSAENESLRQKVESLKPKEEKPKVKWGCYVFEGDENLYCPACYDTKGKKYLTTRTIIKSRQCSVCKANLGS